MKNFSAFQIGLYVLFSIGIVFAVLIFSGKISVGTSSTSATLSGSVVIWGTLPQDAVNAATDIVHQTYKNVTVHYQKEDPATLQDDLVNALASGSGPDILIPSNVKLQ